jgi:hypothetical protein
MTLRTPSRQKRVRHTETPRARSPRLEPSGEWLRELFSDAIDLREAEALRDSNSPPDAKRPKTER